MIALLRSKSARPRNRPRNYSTRIDRGGFYAPDAAEKPRRPPSVVPLSLSPPPSPAFFSACTREISLSLCTMRSENAVRREREREKRKGIELIFREILIDIFVGIKYFERQSSRERDFKLFFKGEFREGKEKKNYFHLISLSKQFEQNVLNFREGNKISIDPYLTDRAIERRYSA